MSEESKALAIINDKTNVLTKIIANDQLPADTRKQFEEINDILASEKLIPDLYPEIVSEVSVSTSLFQDRCVQYETCFTPHRKLRQAMLEMDNRLRALYTAKTGHKKAILKLEEAKMDMEDIKEEYEDSSQDRTDRDKRKLEIKMAKKVVRVEELERDFNSAAHMIKDAILKVAQQRELIKEYEVAAKETGMSFDEAEVYHFVMYFTKDAESQLRTGGRVDTGTFGAIAQLPEEIRKKVLWNINFIKNKLKDGYDGDYIHIIYKDILEPKWTGQGEIEGMNVKEFLKITPIKTISSDNQLTHENVLINE